MQIQKVIEQLGFSAKEARVYLAALHLGESHISDIADKIKMPRSSVQVIVDKLHKEGLMNFYVMRRYKYWIAENPERLLHNLKKREEIMREAMPSLIAIKKSNWGKRDKKADIDADFGVFRMMADSSQQPILITNEEVEIAYVNKAWEEQLGYALAEIKGENPRILQSGKTPSEVYERMWKALRTEKMFQSDKVIDKKKDGTFFNLLTTIFSLRHNNRLFYIQILDDITERKRVDELRQKFVRTGIS